MKKGLTKLQIIQLPFMALLLVILIAANVLMGIFSEAITIYLYGFGNNFDNLDYERGDQICQDIAEEGVVLLKNENGALPLDGSDGKDEDGKDYLNVNVFGWGATDGGFVISGAGSGSADDRGGNAELKVKFLEGLKRAGFRYNEKIIKMYEDYRGYREGGPNGEHANSGYWNPGGSYPFFNLIEPDVSAVEPYIDEAKSFSNTALVVISRLGGEARDLPRTQRKLRQDEDKNRTYLQISKEEEDLLNLVKDNFEKVIVIINATNAMELGFLDDKKIDSAVSVGGVGQSGAVSIANILRGRKTVETYDEDGEVVSSETVRVSPSGKTSDAYAYDLTTAATFANAPGGENINTAFGGVMSYGSGDNTNKNYIDYAEGIYVGYKWYETADTMNFWSGEFAKNKWNVNGYDEVVQYPFGFGKTYTEFEWEITSAEPANNGKITKDTEITVQVLVTNVGNYPARDVVELYYTPPYNGQIEKSSVNLCAFAKTEVLEANGGFQRLTLKFNANDMASYDCYGKVVDGSGYVLEKGNYEISLRTDSHTVIDTLTYHADADTRVAEEASNHFTGDEATDGGIAIDGVYSGSNANIKYLSRKDFAGTFPEINTQNRTKDAKISALKDNWLTTKNDTDKTYTQGADGSLLLYRDDNGVFNAKNGDDKSPYEKNKLNLDLILELGNPDNWNSAKWDELLNQITVSELNRLVEGGGYRTAEVASIGKPEFTDLDGPSGLNSENASSNPKSSKWTSYPVESVMGQTWNARLAYIYGLAVGNEANETGTAGWYAPACNLHRSPFSGRNFEYFSEDPYLSGILCAETTRGATNTGLYCYVKHFAVNETENGRKGLYTWLTEQTLREIYLKPFEIVVKQGNANAMMTAFNRIGATWAGGSYALLTEVLREEWGFKGSVVTDYITGGTYMSTDQGLRAGNDLWLNGLRADNINSHNDKSSPTALACARNAAKNIVYTYCNTVYRQNLFNNGGADEDLEKYATEIGSKAAGGATAYWKYWGWLPIDLVGFGGLAVWIYFCFFHKMFFKKKETPDSTAEITKVE